MRTIRDLYPLKMLKFIVGLFLCFPPLLFPYALRMSYIKILAFFVHLPFVIFGKLTRYLFKKLKINLNDIEWE